MLHPRMYPTFARVNGRKGVIDGWMKFLLQIFASSGYVRLSRSFTQYISAIVNTTASFKHLDFMSAAFSNLSFPKIRTASCVCVEVGIDFTKRCHLFWLDWQKLRCVLHERPAFLCKCYLLKPQNFQTFHSQSETHNFLKLRFQSKNCRDSLRQLERMLQLGMNLPPSVLQPDYGEVLSLFPDRLCFVLQTVVDNFAS